MTPSLDDASLSLAFSVYSNPGAYALLIGAGVSAPTVKTAWGVLSDLCTKVADLTEGDPGDDAPAWYERTFGSPPEYGSLLERLAPTAAERQRLLAGYFEPTAEEADNGEKAPTSAHHALARLVAGGWIRVVVTLNFDRLIEQAIRSAGVEPTVVSSPADIEGLAPLHTLKACVIHLHGDYLTPSAMLNTESELSTYPAPTTALARSVLRDYGLVIAGWSATYDTRLRELVSAHYPSRYTMTWIEPGPQSDVAGELLARKGGRLASATADDALGRLADAVDALDSRQARHPLSVAVAVETAKRELAGQNVAIPLHDRLKVSLENLRDLPELNLGNYRHERDYDLLVRRVEEAARLPAALISTLSLWGDASTDRWWLDDLERFAIRPSRDGLVALLDLPTVAGSWLYYAAGVGATAARRFDLVRNLLTAESPDPYHRTGRLPLSRRLHPASAFDSETLVQLFYDRMSPLLRESLSIGTDQVEDAWQRFEVVRMAHAATAKDHFEQQLATYQAAHERAAEVERRFEAEGPHGVMQTERYEATQDVSRASGALMRSTPHPLGSHLLSAEVDLDVYTSIAADRLRDEVEIQSDSHPLVAAGIFATPEIASTALRAASLHIGVIGKELAWNLSHRDRPGLAGVPSAVWLDSRRTVQ